MKKLLAIAFAVLSIGFVGSSTAEAATSNVANTSIVSPQRYNRRYNRRVRVTTQTRIVRQGRRTFRETYRVTHFGNGRTQTTLISRVRVR